MQIGPYSVLDEVARGGHGVVYRARGARGQLVALKLLLAHRAQNPKARARFQAEVSALARLRHPHVVAILGAGEHEGSPWLALEFVEGESLEARLRRGPVPIHEALRVAQQLAQALSYVHACGVLHRDLKPANVLLRGDRALLTDFGLVLDADASVSRLTATGIFQGTPGYWAPEQAQGLPSQHSERTDVYGLGGVLYACLTGNPPVQAESLQAYLQTVRFRATPPPLAVRPEVPAWLSSLCMRCLAVELEARPSTVEEVARALVLAEGTTVGGDSPARRYGPLAIGAVVLACAGVLGVWSLSRGAEEGSPAGGTAAVTSSTHDAVPSLASDPGVEGEPSSASATQRQAQAWLESGVAHHRANRHAEAIADFDRALELDLPEDVADQVRRWRAAAEDRQEGDPRSLLASARAHSAAGRHAEALADYDAALELDPRSADGYYARGLCKAKLGRLAESLADYDAALELDPRHPRAYADRGASKATLGRYAEAIPDLDRALELDPQSEAVYYNRAVARAGLGRYAESLADFDAVLGLDPRHALAHYGRGLSDFKLRRYAAAIDDLSRCLELDPSSATAYYYRGLSKQKLRRYEEALEDYQRSLELDPSSALAYAERGTVRAALGRVESALDDLDRALELDPSLVHAYVNRGRARQQLGRDAEALADLERALELGGLSATVVDKVKRLRDEIRARLGRD